LLSSKDDARGLVGNIIKIQATATKSSTNVNSNMENGSQLFSIIQEYSLNNNLGIIFRPENINGDQKTVYIAGNATAFTASMRSGRFFSLAELNANSYVLIAFADTWADRFFYREQKKLYGASGCYDIIGVLEPDDPLQRDDCDILSPLGFNGILPGTWYVSTDDQNFVNTFTSKLRSIGLSAEITPWQQLSWDISGFRAQISDKFFVVFLLAFITSLANLILYYLRNLSQEVKWNRIRSLVGARKITHYPYAVQSVSISILLGTVIGGLLQTFFWRIIFSSSKNMLYVVSDYLSLCLAAIIFFLVIFTISYGFMKFV